MANTPTTTNYLMDSYNRIRDLIEAEFPGTIGASVHVVVEADQFAALAAKNKRYRAPGGRGLVIEHGGIDLGVIDEASIEDDLADEDDENAEG